MQIARYKFIDNKIVESEEVVATEDWDKKADLVIIRYDNANEISDYLNKLSLPEDYIEHIIHRENDVVPKSEGKYFVEHFPVSQEDNIYKSDFITLLISEKLIVAIIPDHLNILQKNILSSRLLKYFANLRYYILYELISDVLTVTVSNVACVRKRLHKIEKEMITNPQNLTAEEVMDMRNDIAQFADIVEDQDISFDLLQHLFINKQDMGDSERVKQVISGYERLNKTIGRLEEKAESLRLHFMLVQQEQSTRKINVLTIIQAIFVPLTFIVGVYGMNFVNMPELQWHWGYFAIWGVFIAIVITLLYYFKKHGWFK